MKFMNRREFIHDSAALSALLAGLNQIPVQGKEKTKTVKKGDVNEQLRIAVVGVNGRGKDHVKELAGRPDCFVANGHVDDQPWFHTPMAQTAQLFRALGGGRFAVAGDDVSPYFSRPVVGRDDPVKYPDGHVGDCELIVPRRRDPFDKSVQSVTEHAARPALKGWQSGKRISGKPGE